ncbi:MAG: hypothetical protein HC886_22490 [Leptolyngbyaceae cyanobacterium SM1_1_3]|nr:hypothetical protein [Leptolyngbyaceae cyanobacterium SM1_1_3]NJN05019.1 hypothetical protein [Leptolyngbyaceae cyanobacterium RM1_1_2]NJO11965.1 hypothetical protein [Leptolyngbyaceae cyanobacterium SL_1_1]
MKRIALTIFSLAISAAVISPAQAITAESASRLDELRAENLDKSTGKFDQLRRDNLDKDQNNFDELRVENLSKAVA